MRCPIDDHELAITERQGIEIDYCPKCRGVWLDRGELDKLIDRTSEALEPRAREHHDRRPRNYEHHDHGDRYHYKKRKKSVLSELFDF